MTFRSVFAGHRERARRTSPSGLLVLTLAGVLGLGTCSSREASPAQPPPQAPPRTQVASQPCAPSGTPVFPTATTRLLRTSGGLPAERSPFSVSLVPTVPVPIRIGTELGFLLSSSTAGYASLYLIDPVYAVQVLAENLPVPAGSLEYPSSQGFTLRAAEPVGYNRAILLVTRQPFGGFSGNDTLTAPVSTALDGRAFVSLLNDATAALPGASWVADEVCLRIVG